MIFVFTKSKTKADGKFNKANLIILCNNEYKYIQYYDICYIELGDSYTKNSYFGLEYVIDSLRKYFNEHQLNQEMITRIINANDTELKNIIRSNRLISNYSNLAFFIEKCPNTAIEKII